MKNADHLLEIKNLNIEFKTHEGLVKAVDDVSFNIPKGKTIGVVGESGSGKSVTALSVMGLIPSPPGEITKGQILFKGQDLLKASEKEMLAVRGNQISMIFQEPMTSLNPVFTVGEQIAEVLRLHHGLNRKQALDRAVELLHEVGIPNPKTRIASYPHEMSGGQKQRVMIAMAIGCSPDLLIADEPTTALDVTIQKQVIELMQKLQEEYKMSLLFITHDLGVVADIADHVVVMYRGRIVEQNNVGEIFKNPQHAYTKGLLACRPRLDRRPQRLPTVEDFLEENEVDLREQARPALPREEEPLLKVSNLKKYFTVRSSFWSRSKQYVKAVDDVSFDLYKGRTLGLVGESGCGKTTLGRCLLRLIEPNEGQIIYEGRDIVKLDRAEMLKMRRKMQIIFQDPFASLNPRMTIASALLEPMKIHGLGGSRDQRWERARDLLIKVGLQEKHLKRYPHEFSGGQRQRICIARALAVEPEFIVCDESVSALDVSVQAQVLNLLLDLQDEYQLSYVFISHDLSVVKYISNEVMVMNKGVIVEAADADKIYTSPQHPYTRDLLSAIPKGL